MLAAAIRAKLSPNPPDIATILGQISGLLDDSITGLTIREGGPPAIDLSKINFEALAQRFKESTHKNTDLEALKAAIAARLEELVIFDILTRPAPELSTTERDEVKKVAKALLTRLNSLLVLNWRQKAAARSTLKLAIEDTLDSLPESYDGSLYAQKCSALFEHVYESYPERNTGVYARM